MLQYLPKELLDDLILLQQLRGWTSHGQDTVSDPEDGYRTAEIHKTQSILPDRISNFIISTTSIFFHKSAFNSAS